MEVYITPINGRKKWVILYCKSGKFFFGRRKESVRGATDFAQAAQLNEFLDELPEVPRDKVCVDDSDGYQAPGKKLTIRRANLPPNEFGFDFTIIS